VRAAGWVALLLGGCMSEAEYRERSDAAACAWLDDCFDDDYGECLQDAESAWEPMPASCTYQPSQARKCVRRLERLDCPSDDGGVELPAACDDVYAC